MVPRRLDCIYILKLIYIFLHVMLRCPAFVDEIEGLLNIMNLVGFLVGNFHHKFIFDGH